MKKYFPRVADGLLEEQLEASGAVLVEGPKWCGKTTTSARRAASIIEMQLAVRDPLFRTQISVDVAALLEGQTPRLIDEWQLEPELWDIVRVEVDRRGEVGQFILTGSATPPDRTKIHHSGTGRIARLRMRPMSLSESGDSTKDVSLEALFDGAQPHASATELTLEELAFLACRGGWPQAITLGERAALRQAKNYLNAVVEADITEQDGVRRSPQLARRILRSYARLISSEAPETAIVKDAGASVSAVRAYLQVLRDIFVIEDLHAWNPNLRSKTAIRQTPTRHFADPSIACAALGAGPGSLAKDLETFGLVFEDLCIRDLRVYADALEGDVYHYRDKSGLECDAVVCLHDGRYALIEVKLGGPELIVNGLETVEKLTAKIDQKRMGPPAFGMVLTGVNSLCFTAKNGVHVVPIGRLGP